MRAIMLAALMLTIVGAMPVVAASLPGSIDKAFYCAHVYAEAARVIDAQGDPAAARVVRAFGKQWLSYSYDLSSGLTRRQINAFRPQYQAEAKAAVAAKRYRHDCSKR
ncbi:hypothetical protein [Devosia sp. A16]|uniref:hypothetical protein n=1 Tax=Devosia sp. A16 TaxID=1736675 RepID=UPI000A68AFA3|nr:hypothetical protein [Devosia sp. A16]